MSIRIVLVFCVSLLVSVGVRAAEPVKIGVVRHDNNVGNNEDGKIVFIKRVDFPVE